MSKIFIFCARILQTAKLYSQDHKCGNDIYGAWCEGTHDDLVKGAKRGEAVVTAIAHESRQTFAQDYYCGTKESEVKVVRKLLDDHL
jgi:hypothetical protein